MFKELWIRFILLVTAFSAVLANTVDVANAADICVRPGGSRQCFASIQAAVDAANSGDQIIIRPGKYVEQVTIFGKDITLVGREGAVVQAPEAMEQTLLGVGNRGRPIIGVTGAEVTIRGLIIDGANSAANNPFIEGITFVNAGGVIRDNVIRNVGFGAPTLPIDENGFPLYQGDALVVINYESTHRTVTITDNRIVDFNDIGIVIGSFAAPENPASANLTVHVLENTVVGLGPTEVIDQWGMLLFSDGFSDPQFYLSGTIQENRLRNLVSVAPFPFPSIGMELDNANNLVISDNQVENADLGIEALRTYQSQISENDFAGTRPRSDSSIGLFVSGSDNRVFDNDFRRLGVGIFLPVEGFFLGSALNTMVHENDFENVLADTMTGPGVFDFNAKVAPSSSKIERYRPIPAP